MPAAGMQWLIIDLTEPIAIAPCARASASPKTFFSAAISVLSPSGMPVPWASIRLTLAGSTPQPVVGPADRQRLAVDAGSEQPVAAPVARLADAAHHGVDPVAIGQRIADALQDDDAQALAEQGAVAAAARTAAPCRAPLSAPSWVKITVTSAGSDAFTPPASIIRLRPLRSSSIAAFTASSDEEQAASSR